MKIKISALDRKFSLFIRSRAGWKCERLSDTNHSQKLECSHFHGRRKKSVRFDPENSACLCFSCHRYFTENPEAHTEWFKKRLGETRFHALTLRANVPQKPDYEMIRLWLKHAMKNSSVPDG